MKGSTRSAACDPRRLDSMAAGSASGLLPSAAASARLGAEGSAAGSCTGDAMTAARKGVSRMPPSDSFWGNQQRRTM